MAQTCRSFQGRWHLGASQSAYLAQLKTELADRLPEVERRRVAATYVTLPRKRPVQVVASHRIRVADIMPDEHASPELNDAVAVVARLARQPRANGWAQ